jgi:hypothetical protein
MESPELLTLSQVGWQVFGTFTFRGVTPPSESIRVKMWFAMLRRASAQLRLYFPSVLWLLRQERGETTYRQHFHALFAGFPERMVNPQTCFLIKHAWEEVGGGKGPVHLFDPRLAGAEYVTKCLGGFSDSTLGGDIYESEKFGSKACELMRSHSLDKCLANGCLVSERRLRTVKKKTVGAVTVDQA